MATKKKQKAKKKRKTARKRAPKRKKVAKKGKTSKPLRKGKPKRITATPELPTEPLGRVTHYFPHVKAAAIKIEREGIGVGDTLYIKGHTTRLKQKVESLQVNHQPVTQAGPGEEVGIRVKSRTREHDLVFKL